MWKVVVIVISSSNSSWVSQQRLAVLISQLAANSQTVLHCSSSSESGHYAKQIVFLNVLILFLVLRKTSGIVNLSYKSHHCGRRPVKSQWEMFPD